MDTTLYILAITVQHLFPLFILFILASIALYFMSTTCALSSSLKKKSYRLYINIQYILISTITLLGITIVYWLIDTQLFPLNIPAQPYIFFILIITILFGFKVGIVASLFSTILIIYYLYDPRYMFSIFIHTDDFILTLWSLGISVFTGNLIRNYQKRLIYESDQLKELIKARDQFTSAAAHDLKTPLTVIKLYLQSMMKADPKTSTKEAKKSLKHIDAETDKVIELINSLFDFSRIESKKMTLTKKKYDIITLCKTTTKKIAKIHSSHTIVFSCKESHLTTFIDPLAIERVISNLITNAVKYSPEGSTIKVKVTSNKRFIQISISDQGKGIPKDVQKKLFDPFYQAKDSKSGLGLGLYIAKSFVELHKGTIWVDSKEGVGSTFYIRLPNARILN